MTVCSVDTLASIPENKSMPPVFSISAISTVTPLTIRIGPHGMARSDCDFIGGVNEDQHDRPRECPHARR